MPRDATRAALEYEPQSPRDEILRSDKMAEMTRDCHEQSLKADQDPNGERGEESRKRCVGT